MIQRVPSWDIDDPPNPSHNLYPSSSSAAAPPQLSMTNTFRASCHRSDYEVAELTWRNGHLSAHGLVKPTTPRQAAGGTLESIVNQAKLLHPSSATWHHPGGPHLTAALDSRGPTTGHHRPGQVGVDVDLASGIGSCDVSRDRGGRKPARPGETAGPVGSMDSTRVVVDETDDLGFATTNSITPLPDEGNRVSGSPDTENTSFGDGGGCRPLTVADDHDSACHSHRSLSQREMAGEEDEKIMEGDNMRSTTVSTRRSRAAAVHNQSERKRRDKINQKMRTLQKLVPNSNKTDKASMLDEVIEYLKQLQAQVQMMSRMSSIPSMMMPPVNMQQLQMTMMAQMAQMGMGMGMMDMASLGTRPASISPVMPGGAFLPMIGAGGAWDPSAAAAAAAAERMQQPAGGGVMPDPFSAFVVCQPQQQMTMDAYQRMVALYQQTFQQNQPTNPK